MLKALGIINKSIVCGGPHRYTVVLFGKYAAGVFNVGIKIELGRGCLALIELACRIEDIILRVAGFCILRNCSDAGLACFVKKLKVTYNVIAVRCRNKDNITLFKRFGIVVPRKVIVFVIDDEGNLFAAAYTCNSHCIIIVVCHAFY